MIRGSTIIIMSSRLISTVKSYTGPILHSVLAMNMGQAPTESYTKHLHARSHDTKRMPSDKHENAQLSSCGAKQSSCGAKRRHYLEFHHLYHSYPSAVMLRTWMFYRLELVSVFLLCL